MENYRSEIRLELNSSAEKEQKIDVIFENITFIKIGYKELQEVKKSMYKKLCRQKRQLLEKALKKVDYEYEIATYPDGFGVISYIDDSPKSNKETKSVKQNFKCYYWKKVANQKALQLASVYEVLIFIEYQRLHKHKVPKDGKNILVQYKYALALVSPKGKIIGYFYPDAYLEISEKVNNLPKDTPYLFSIGRWQKYENK